MMRVSQEIMIDKIRFPSLVVATFILVPYLSAPALAEEPEHHEELHSNYLALFIGLTSEDRRESGLALGIEYEYRLNRSFGIGVLAEHTFGDVDTTVYAMPFAYHSGRWKAYVGPGIEDGDLGNESLWRVGAEYAFEVGRWEVSPQLDIDFIDGDTALVLGVTIGKGF